MMRDDLAALVQQMIDRGILFDDAQREFERDVHHAAPSPRPTTTSARPPR